jgi:hypothetical protein
MGKGQEGEEGQERQEGQEVGEPARLGLDRRYHP